MSHRPSLSIVLAAGIVSVLLGKAAAGTISLEHTFTTVAPQSIYGPGPGPTAGAPTVFPTSWSESIVDGSITTLCPLGFCVSFGDRTRAVTSGTVGFTVEPRITGGEVTASVPVRIGLGLPDGPLHSGQPFTVSSTYQIPAGLQFRAVGPQFSVGVDMNLTANITVDHTECNITCTSIGPPPLAVNNFTTEVLALNRQFDNTLRVFGQTLVDDLASKSIPLPLRQQELPIRDVTQIYTLGRVRLFPLPFIAVEEMGSGTGALSGSDSVEAARLAADVGNLTAYIFTLNGIPVPPLNAKVVGSFPFAFGYNALQIDAGIGVGMRNTFSLDPRGATIQLRLDQTGQVFEFAAGDSVNIIFPEGFDEITLTPTILLEAPQFRADIDALVSPLIDVSAIGVTLGPISPTLIDPPPYHLADFPINAWDKTFALGGFEDYSGNSIRLSLNQEPSAVPTPPALVLLALGVVVAGARARWTTRERRLVSTPGPRPAT